MGKLDRKVALVTGGNSGIGFATAQEFVGEGAHVFITGRREKELAAAVKEIGRNVTGIRADVNNSEDLDRLFSQIKSERGKLDVVFANASTDAVLGALRGPALEAEEETNRPHRTRTGPPRIELLTFRLQWRTWSGPKREPGWKVARPS